MSEKLRAAALHYHAHPVPGKIGVSLTKPTQTQFDLSLAYTPGVAEPVHAIAEDAACAYQYTNKGNLVAVVSNGTAVLGLGNVGALASKPVMEGKAALFKRFADVDVFDIEINTTNPDAVIETIVNIAPTFGGINLEDIKAPDCFYIEQSLKERLNIPVFHDDQHGTAVVVAAGLLNALEIVNKKLSEVKIVCLGAGAAGIATMHLLKKLGADKNLLYLVDREGVIHDARPNLPPSKQIFAITTTQKTLEAAMHDADVFIGVSGPNLLPPSYLKYMARKPIIFALSNPTPEIAPEIIPSIRQDCIVATGRCDYPNQVNNVLCFPYIFRGALDARARSIEEPMLFAAVNAIKDLAKEDVPDDILFAYGLKTRPVFGSEYLLPKPLDTRLRTVVSNAVSQAAFVSGMGLPSYHKTA